MRRAAVLSIALVSLQAGGCAGPGHEATATPQTPALVGAWRSRVQFGSGAFASIQDLEFLYVFNLGGTMTESSNYDGAPPVPPAYGAWTQIGSRAFEARYEFYATRAPGGFDELKRGGGWLPSGRGVFHEKITLAEDGQSFTSTIGYEVFDREGAPTGEKAEAKGRGTRIR